jgi:hypothetical protein
MIGSVALQRQNDDLLLAHHPVAMMGGRCDGMLRDTAREADFGPRPAA